MVKKDLAEKVYEVLGFSKREASSIVEEFFNIIKESLRVGEDVKLSGFGSFLVKYKAPRKGRNPQTGEPIIIDARKVVTFRPSTLLKERINGKGVSEDRRDK